MSVKVVYHGHATVEILSGAFRLQIDPFYTSNPLADVKAEQVHPTHILLSHAHFDHIEDAEAIAKRTGAPIIASHEVASYFGARGVTKGHGMNIGGGYNFEFGRATMTHARHTSSFPDGSYGGVAAGWVIETGGVVIYFAGDTAIFGDMAWIGKHWKIDLAMLPIGDNYTMGPAQAIEALKMLKPRKVIPMHFNTFPPIRQDAGAFAAAVEKATRVKAVVLAPGGDDGGVRAVAACE